MVKLTLEQIKQQLGTNVSRHGIHSFFLKSPTTKVLVAFKDQTAELGRRLIMHRDINGERKIRMIVEVGDRIQLVDESGYSSRSLGTSSFINTTEYEYDGRRFHNAQPVPDLVWHPIVFTNTDAYCSQLYVDVQKAVLKDALLNYVEVHNIGLPRISFETTERYSRHSGLAFGLVFDKPFDYTVTVLTPRDNVDEYEAVIHVKFALNAMLKVQTHNVETTNRVWNLIRKKLLDSNMLVDHSSENMLLIPFGDMSKLDIEIIQP